MHQYLDGSHWFAGGQDQIIFPKIKDTISEELLKNNMTWT